MLFLYQSQFSADVENNISSAIFFDFPDFPPPPPLSPPLHTVRLLSQINPPSREHPPIFYLNFLFLTFVRDRERASGERKLKKLYVKMFCDEQGRQGFWARKGWKMHVRWKVVKISYWNNFFLHLQFSFYFLKLIFFHAWYSVCELCWKFHLINRCRLLVFVCLVEKKFLTFFSPLVWIKLNFSFH